MVSWKMRIFKCVSQATSRCNADHKIQVDRDMVLNRGREVVAKLLIDLQIRKSTADGEGARSFYTNLTNPLEGWEGELRDLVLRKKQVRVGSTV